MEAVVDVKIRRVGTSLGVLLPKKLIEKEGLKEGQMVEISITRRPTPKELEKLIGSAKWLKGFEREKGDKDRF